MDAHKNFSYSTVLTAPSPAASGTSLVVTSGQGARFPTVPFNATVWPSGAQPLSTNAEIVRVTAVATDTLTITRAQESTSARTIVAGDQIAATVTAKTLTDVEQALPHTAQATVDFGFSGVGEGDTASVTVAATWAHTESVIACSAAGQPTADHDSQDALIEGVQAVVSNIVDGVGFDVEAYAPQGAWGRYLINVIGV